MERIHSHTAIAYSEKAASHKHVHPYLRYGMLIGDFPDSLPKRLTRHGNNFDFMLLWSGIKPTKKEKDRFVEIMGYEIEASRILQEMFSRKKHKITVLHRRMVLDTG